MTGDNGYADVIFNPIKGGLLDGIQYSLDTSNPLTPKLTAENGVNIFDPTQYFYAGQSVNHDYNPEVDPWFGASLANSYTLGGHASTFEFGGRFRNAHKFANQNQSFTVPTANAGDPSLAMTNFLGGFTDPNFYGNSYKFGPTVDYDKVKAFGAVGPDPKNPNIQANNFNLSEKISPAHLVSTMHVSRFRIVAGGRFENNSEGESGQNVTNTPH